MREAPPETDGARTPEEAAEAPRTGRFHRPGRFDRAERAPEGAESIPEPAEPTEPPGRAEPPAVLEARLASGEPWTVDLEVFEGPFDLLITLILNEEVDLLDVNLAEIVLAYIERLEARGELDLEAATEFLILIAALLELKSRLMLPSEEIEGLDLEPQEAVEELLARLLEYRRYRGIADELHARLASEQGYRYRSAPLPPSLRQVTLDAAKQAYDPDKLVDAMRALLRTPPRVDDSHLAQVTVSLERRLALLRRLLATRGSFTFDDAVGDADRLTQAVTLFALLELYKSGELVWRQDETFGRIEITAAG